MKIAKKTKKSVNLILYSVIALILLCLIIFTMISYVYKYSEEEAYEIMHMQTQQIKKDINLQMFSDRENLMTMANFTSELYREGKDLSLLFNSFEAIGLFENIGILLPNNTFITKKGPLDVNGKISFAEESQKGEYISGRVKDLIDAKREVVRSAFPVTSKNDGSTIAMIYGMINLDSLRARYEDKAKAMDADLFVLEGKNGNFIIDTKRDYLGNVTELSVTKFNDGFSYEELIENISNGKNGFTSFESLTSNGNLYAHYAPLDFSDWHIMLMQPENVVFARARANEKNIIVIELLSLAVMIGYAFVITLSERKNVKTSQNSSAIRKNLLGLNQKFDRIYEALKNITKFAKARSSFIIDSYSTDYNYIEPALSNKMLSGEERAYFISMLMAYVAKKRKQYSSEVYMTRIVANKTLYKTMPDFYKFIKEHGIKKILFACVSNDDASVSILGVTNPRNKEVYDLLEDIAICFTMAIYNQKHLVKTETMANTDALTNVANRMAYKEDIKRLAKSDLSKLVCIYIDVNELNLYNNKHGHAAGDQMLAFVAETLKNEFADSKIYRMGGDEFLVFAEGLLPEVINERINNVNKIIEEMKYHISIGVKYGDDSLSVEDIVTSAEKKMYVEKAIYYQQKESKAISNFAKRTMEAELTGIKKFDVCLSLMSKRYLGVYCVMHESDMGLSILTPSYFSEMLKEKEHFSEAFKKYVYEAVKSKYHRILLNFLEYDILESNLKNGVNPSVTYTKIDGEKVRLSIYLNDEQASDEIDTVWIFEKEQM